MWLRLTTSMVSMLFITIRTSRLRKRGSPEGRSPYGGGVGGSPRYIFFPFPGTNVMANRFFSTLLVLKQYKKGTATL